jgi:hypothetical protein
MKSENHEGNFRKALALVRDLKPVMKMFASDVNAFCKKLKG